MNEIEDETGKTAGDQDDAETARMIREFADNVRSNNSMINAEKDKAKPEEGEDRGMNEMIYRVTNAILGAMDVADGLDAESAERYARAAISSMRVPTDEMTSAGRFVIKHPDEYGGGSPVNAASHCWMAMIDETLRK